MIAAWMVYCSMLAVLLLCGAIPMERFVHDRGGATRRVWALALVATVVLPAGALLLQDAPPAYELDNVVVATSPTAGLIMESVDTLAPLDGILRTMWMGTSATLLLLLVAAIGGTAWRRRSWRPDVVDGVHVLLSNDVGPAVVGFAPPRIVLPRWVLALGDAERSMMLRHEEEHLRARDPLLLFFSVAVAIAMPWNAAVWYMLRRLRLAVEVDCDRRVMGAGNIELRRYAELLLSVGARRMTPACGVGFSVGRPFLEERIDRMTLPRSEHRHRHAVLVAVGLVGLLGAAWSVPQPVRATLVSSTFETCPDKASRELQSAEVSRALLAAEWSS